MPASPVATVVLIEDDPASALLIERVLARLPDVRLLVARTGRDGLALAAQGCDLLVTDLNLPDLSPEELLNAARTGPGSAGVPIVVVSADARLEQVQWARTAGASVYLTKPLDLSEFVAVVESAIAGTPSPTEALEDRPADTGGDGAATVFEQLRLPGGEGNNELMTRFVETSAAHVAALRAALSAADREDSAYLAHRLEGKLSMFGATLAATLVDQVGDRALAGETAEAESLLTGAEAQIRHFVESHGGRPGETRPG